MSKIFRINNSVPSKTIRQGFDKHFAGARSVEWTSHKKFYEAIFYDNDIEKIARFDHDGNLIETRINITPADISDTLRNKISDELEIMNCIEVDTIDGVSYEFIVRDRDLIRYVLQVDCKGIVSEKEKL